MNSKFVIGKIRMVSDPFKKPDGISILKWRFLLGKRYFETGYGLTNYVKYVIALFGLSSLDIGKTMALGLVYAVACFVIGYYWYKKHFIEADNEVSNRFNLFMREMREMKEKVENNRSVDEK